MYLGDFDISALEAWLAAAGHNPRQARRILHAYYENQGCVDYDTLNIGKALAAFLRQSITPMGSAITDCICGTDGTRRLLIRLGDGAMTESVLMPSHRPERAAACISSQIGCAVGCAFCASTRGGLARNLSAGEMVEQFLHLRRLAAEQGRRLATAVFMGMGEPLLNFDAVAAAIGRIAGERLGALGGRQITVSTVGIVPGIDRLADLEPRVNLAISLHAPDDELRGRLIPLARRWPIAQILAAAERFAAHSGRMVTVSYVLLRGVNDSEEQARRLADMLGGRRFHVNLIPYNSIGDERFSPSPHAAVENFLRVLRVQGVVAHARQPRGQDVEAACGQLRRRAVMA